MLDITVKVPEERVAEFYAMYGHWLASPAGGAPGPPVAEADRKDWAKDDVELATKVWKKFSPRAQAMFSTLIDNPNTEYDGDELAEMHNIPNGNRGVAGVLAWPSRHCFAVGRNWCWTWHYPDGENVKYSMDDVLADLFKKARG
jgi:hypothetical protein